MRQTAMHTLHDAEGCVREHNTARGDQEPGEHGWKDYAARPS